MVKKGTKKFTRQYRRVFHRRYTHKFPIVGAAAVSAPIIYDLVTQNGFGQPISEFQSGNWQSGMQAFLTNVRNQHTTASGLVESYAPLVGYALVRKFLGKTIGRVTKGLPFTV